MRLSAKFKLLLSLLNCLLTLQLPIASAQNSITLQAGVQLDDKVSALDQTLSPGNQFNQSSIEKKIQKQVEQNQWFKIPLWAAGSWKTLKAQTTSEKDEITGNETIDGSEYTMKTSFSMGIEKDRTGQIWDFVDHNYWTHTEYDYSDAYCFVTYTSPGTIENNQLKKEGRFIAFLVDKATGKIISTEQKQSFSIYSYKAPNLMQKKSWQRAFDWQGNTTHSLHSEANCIRTSPFTVDPSTIATDGRLLSPLFKKYLIENRLSALVPQSVNEIDAEINAVMTSGTKNKHK